MIKQIKTQVLRDAFGHYKIDWQLPQNVPVQLYRADAADGDYVYVGELHQPPFVLELPLSYPRQYFKLVLDEAAHHFAERRFVLDGAPNLRDFGGYSATGGGRVKWGRLFRSGRLSELSEADKQFLDGLGVHTVFDFRTESETEKSPTVLASSSTTAIRHVPINPGNHMDFLTKIKEGTLTSDMTEGMMIDVYQSLGTDHVDVYTQVLQHLQDGSEPLLIHCSAGKDRTGVGAALILLTLGVHRDTIMEDYLLTGQFYPTPVELDFLRKDFGFTEADIEITLPIFGVKPDYMQAFFDTVDRNFGSDANYLETLYGLDPAKREKIAQAWLD